MLRSKNQRNILLLLLPATHCVGDAFGYSIYEFKEFPPCSSCLWGFLKYIFKSSDFNISCGKTHFLLPLRNRQASYTSTSMQVTNAFKTVFLKEKKKTGYVSNIYFWQSIFFPFFWFSLCSWFSDLFFAQPR